MKTTWLEVTRGDTTYICVPHMSDMIATCIKETDENGNEFFIKLNGGIYPSPEVEYEAVYDMKLTIKNGGNQASAFSVLFGFIDVDLSNTEEVEGLSTKYIESVITDIARRNFDKVGAMTDEAREEFVKAELYQILKATELFKSFAASGGARAQ